MNMEQPIMDELENLWRRYTEHYITAREFSKMLNQFCDICGAEYIGALFMAVMEKVYGEKK